VQFRDPVAEANKLATELSDGNEANGEADVLVLLAHEGAPQDNIKTVEDLMKDPVFGDFTRVSAEIDAIFSGHTHQPYAFEVPVPGTTKTRPVIQAEDYGEKLGKAVLTYDPTTRSVTASTAQVLDVVGYEPDPAIAAIVATAKAKSAELGKRPLGKITGDILRGYTAGKEDRSIESPMGNFIADVQLDQTSAAGRGGAQIAFMNAGGLRTDLKYGTDGTITYSQAFDVQPFSNDVVTQTLTGAQIKQVLEEQWQPAGAAKPLLHLGVSKGFTYSYDDKQPRNERIIASSMKLNGVTLNPSGTYRVTTNAFLAAAPNGGDNFFTLGKGTDRKTTGDNDLTMLVNYFVGHTPVTADQQPRSTPGVLDSTAPTGTFTVGTTAIWPGQTVTLTQTALNDDVSAPATVKRVITWGDGSAPQTLAAGATTATHTYPAVGSFPVSVALTDEAGNTGPATFTGLSTVVVTAQPGRYALSTKSIWASQSVTLGLSGVSGATKLAVAWGDGTTSTMSSNVGSAAHVYAKAGAFTVKVQPYNAAGAGTPVTVGTVKVTKDTYKPVVTFNVPKNAAKASSWSKITGTATDKGVGVARVRVKLIEQRSGKWYYYTGRTWVKTTSKSKAAAKAAVITVTPSAKGAWSLGLKGIKKGTLTVTFWGSDKVGNTSTGKSSTTKITK
jgi:5'-nucleotidase